MEEQTICPWCDTEIVWDEEIGPEKHCPHCENELSGYRTMQIGIDRDEDEQDDNWDEEQEEQKQDDSYNDESNEGFRQMNVSWLAAEETIRQITDSQEEAPECPSCREYMLEAGKQTVSLQPTVHAVTGKPVIQSPFETVTYICPSCFQTSTVLSEKARNQMLELLAPKE
ncbi:hypothetical protein [Paenibacillus glycanilyticus]|uniref:Small CPxCG-related zinc finger protein n=1 Tax=Paenibacillus glycanilyticus TaxID=126569 RepID=A0ABQ6NXS6_9BACL|nr:hypothetical protein [Paenibacillus glycanilyticus]GMK48764.1 hypothetical protein PghCCS26_58940 [Paenibacillus glycanilyticus]